MTKSIETPAPRKAWNAGKTVQHHAVRVGKETYPSCWKAFLALGLAEGEDYGPCVKFRKALKLSPEGKLSFPVKGKKPILFELVAKG